MDNYNFLIPVMKALIDKAYQLLNLDINLPSLPSTIRSPTFFDDFKTYCKTKEWTTFITSYVCSSQSAVLTNPHYQTTC